MSFIRPPSHDRRSACSPFLQYTQEPKYSTKCLTSGNTLCASFPHKVSVHAATALLSAAKTARGTQGSLY